jgi:hypothetical protein
MRRRMTATARAAETSQSVQPTDKLYLENTLLRVAGALFCHDRKSAPAHTSTIELNKGIADKNIIIRPDPRLGQPGPLAHKIFVALIKKHSGYGRPTQADVSFTRRELMRLIGRTAWSGSASEQLVRALDEIHHAFVRTRFKSADRYIEHSFNIFPEVYIERRAQATDPIEACTVTLARPILASLQDGHFTCLNHALMQELGTIGQAIYMRLFFHFANLYDGHHKKRLTFVKRYDDICVEWLGGLSIRQFQSVIERDQLGPHLGQLVRVGFLSNYRITEAKGRTGFVVTFRPGDTFFADYDRFYRRGSRPTVEFTEQSDRQQIAEPLKVAYLFAKKRRAPAEAGIPYVASKDVETAKFILSHVSFEQVSDFIDYGLTQAKKTRFDVQTLGGLKQYLVGYLATHKQRGARQAAHNKREAEEKATRQRAEYSHFRRLQADRLFATLPAQEQSAIEFAARGKGQRGAEKGSLGQIVLGIERARITAEKYPNKIASFEQWQQRRAQQQGS